jgi:parvulin-like peptidyl-prolyl isomerase
VNGTPLYLDAFERELRRVEIDEEEGGLPPLATVHTQKRVLLDNLIDRRLLISEAEQHNVVVSIDEVESAYQRTRGGWTDLDIDELLSKKDITAAELKRELRELLLIDKYLRDHVFSRIAVTDEEITHYLDKHPELQVQPEAVRALQIVVKTEERAEAILREIRRGASFEDSAVKYSLSPEAKNGGDLGFFERGTMPSIFDEVCFKLRPGEVSKVVASDYGFHLFKVIERRAEALKPVAQLRDEIEQRLRGDKERQAHQAKVDLLRATAKIAIHDKELARVR